MAMLLIILLSDDYSPITELCVLAVYNTDISPSVMAIIYAMRTYSSAFWSPCSLYELTLTPAWRNNYINNKMWDEITCHFSHPNGATFKVSE